MHEHRESAQGLSEAGRLFHQRGWVPASGGNLSVRLSAEHILITASGCHKGELTEDDLVIVDLQGRSLSGPRQASYETPLHCQLYRRAPSIGAVLHTHSVANTVLSREMESVRLCGYELLKALPGIDTHDVAVEIPVFDNDQDIARLSATVDAAMQRRPDMLAYLVEGHGLYAWGESLARTRWAVEALEFMLECELRKR